MKKKLGKVIKYCYTIPCDIHLKHWSRYLFIKVFPNQPILPLYTFNFQWKKIPHKCWLSEKKIVQWLTYYKLLTIHIIVYLYRISVKKDSNVYRCLTKYNSMEFHSCVYEPVFDLYNVGSIPLDPFHLFDWHVILFLKDSRWVVHMFSFKDIPLRFYSVISKQYLA